MGEALLTVGALIGFLTCNTRPKRSEVKVKVKKNIKEFKVYKGSKER